MRFSRIRAVGGRVLHQIARDRRFVVLVVVAPLLLVFFVKTLFEATMVPAPAQNQFVVPFGAYIVHFATFILTAIVLVRERVAETLERMFVNGYRQVEIVAGYLIGYTVLATAVSVMVLAALELLFDLGYDLGRLVEAFVILWLLAVISMALGILVSNLARTEGQVIPFIPLVIIPSFLFSGIIVAVDVLPRWAQAISRLSPMYYANQVLQQVIEGNSATSDFGAALALPIFGLVVLGLATLTLREQS
ncbi:MAG: ABC transporter permease [Acidimicrobiia bacterium]|nr:ABC transporter permease [Acidimicrobiia bacterium]MDH3464115.1 ABC transporter permease [Acidimicrobiia bacterium]